MASLFRSRTRLDIPDLRRRRRRTTKLDRRISAGHGMKLLEAHLKQPHVFALSGSMLIQIITPKRLYTYSPLPMIFPRGRYGCIKKAHCLGQFEHGVGQENLTAFGSPISGRLVRWCAYLFCGLRSVLDILEGFLVSTWRWEALTWNVASHNLTYRRFPLSSQIPRFWLPFSLLRP